MSVFAQLRQRRIVQIVISYLAAGWVLLQVIDQLTSRGVLPDVTYTALLIWFGVGIPAALLIGWHHGEKGQQRAPRSEILQLSLLMLIALAGSAYVVRADWIARTTKAAAEHPLEQRNIAVMYFEDRTRDPELAYLADGLTEELIAELRVVRDLDVLTKNATLAYRNTDLSLDSIANVLDVGTIVTGEVEKRGDQIDVTIQLVDGQSGSVVKREKIEYPASDLLALRNGVVAEAATLLRGWIGEEIRLRRSSETTEIREAWALTQRAERLRKSGEAAVRESGPAAGEAAFKQAEGFLEQARKLDSDWVEPVIQQTALTYRRSRLAAAAGEMDPAVQLIENGLRLADEALAIQANEPRALELRGTLRYFKWLLNVTPDAAERAQLLKAARTDLETAVGLDAALASAHSTLSHLLYNEDLGSALVAARRAYEEDAYLEVAADVVWRLFYGNFDLENFTQSLEWCLKGSARFPDDYRFAYCELRLMASPATKPDVAHAWELLAKIDSLAPAPRKPFERARGEMAVGGVLGRAAKADSAKNVLTRARAKVNVNIDPSYDLLWFEAYMRIFAGDKDEAFALMKRAVLANPDQGFKRGETVPWMWREVQNDPRFDALYTRK